MSKIARKPAPINVVFHFPTSEAGKEELAVRVADVHAACVNQRLKSLTCPNYQKLELLDAVILTVKERAHTQKTLLSPIEPDIST